MGIIRRLYVSAIAFLSQLVSSDPAINAELHATDLESQLQETLQPELSLTTNLQTPQPQPQQQHSFTTNQQPTNTEIAVNQTSFPWAKILIAFCLSAAMQIDLNYEQIDQHTKPYLKLYLRAVCIALTFVSLILSQLINDKFPLASRMLEKVGITLGFASFFIILALPLMT
ncbi:hypothetical protein NC651_037750 [Populus alba x Populus x berolinensis]|nr:hypothetical protein NC651_037750 [Populus alba x Populus x berolinensis]